MALGDKNFCYSFQCREIDNMNIHNCDEILRTFIHDGGCFLFLGKDDQAYKVFRGTLATALMGIKFSISGFKNPDMSPVIEQIDTYRKSSLPVIIILEFRKPSDYALLRDLRIRFSRAEVPIIVLIQEVNTDVLTLLQEMGTNTIVIVPYSAKNIVEKIANTIKPSGLSEIIDNCQKLLANKQYESVLNVCENILRRKPDSTAAYMLKGDTYLAMAESKTGQEAQKDRDTALIFYDLAWKGTPKYVEPLKRLVKFYEAQKNISERMRFLLELDVLIPLNVDRKIDIGAILIGDLGQKEEAIKYFDEAVELINKEYEDTDSRLAVVYKRINEILKEDYPELAKQYSRK